MKQVQQLPTSANFTSWESLSCLHSQSVTQSPGLLDQHLAARISSFLASPQPLFPNVLSVYFFQAQVIPMDGEVVIAQPNDASLWSIDSDHTEDFVNLKNRVS